LHESSHKQEPELNTDESKSGMKLKQINSSSNLPHKSLSAKEPEETSSNDLTNAKPNETQQVEKTNSTERDDVYVQLLIDTRYELRTLKAWQLSDKIRDDLVELGYILEDSKEGTIWRRK
jgi:cysteinyl-tRNA synthetase